MSVMFVLAIVWLFFSLFLGGKWVYAVAKRSDVRKNWPMMIQTPAIGLFVFPAYLHVSEKLQLIAMVIGGCLLFCAFAVIVWQSGMMKSKT